MKTWQFLALMIFFAVHGCKQEEKLFLRLFAALVAFWREAKRAATNMPWLELNLWL